MQLQLQSFASLVGSASAAVQGSARQLVDLTVGSTLRALLEASASIALWVQWLIVQVLQTTRAGTAEGADLDSWMADFGVARLAPVAVSLSIALAPDAVAGMVRGAVEAAITSHINGLGLGVPLVWSRLIQVAYDASPLVAGVSAVLINGGADDIVPGPGGVVKAGAVVVS